MKDGIFEGLLYRALNPRWAAEPLSGEGAALYSGRFNPKGTPALYTSLSPVTAMKEAQQVGSFQPITLLAYRSHIPSLFDARNADAVEGRGLTLEALADPGWREFTYRGAPSPTQMFARDLARDGFNALLTPSFAPGTAKDDLNIVVLRWTGKNAAELSVVDDENRL